MSEFISIQNKNYYYEVPMDTQKNFEKLTKYHSLINLY